jgi:glycopeptide antibiotics resistance protein
MASTARAAMTVLLVGSVLLIIEATTMPWSYYYVGHAHWANVEWVPLSRHVKPEDFILNLVLFVPFGYGGLRAWSPDADDATPARVDRRLLAAVIVAGGLLSISVEVFQVYCHGRMPTTVDVIANTIGTWIGTRLARRR